ncbi:hypothetical protein [Mangrovimonas sp. YM274]|uniref:hypothetical protein n=1 Tax=Mangrovimonas sp. YM274 TaxID=3070660 RepID=UPI0027DE5AB7|nr:hypothetical protein [Mangrovimonas sp. YM274]WMI68235.1 hypothetical protein RBH95_13930 [Mangrovimonas sp. YM274]
MRKYEKVKYTKPTELLVLLFPTAFVFYFTIKILNEFLNGSTLKLVIGLLVSIIYFVAIKKLIIKSTDFKLTSNRLEWNNEKIEFENVESYKIHWSKGAGLKLTLTNGTTKRLSSNSNFCNSDKFVELMRDLDKALVSHNKGKIKRQDSIMETKFGLYLAIVLTTIIVVVTAYSLIENRKINLSNISLITVCLVTIWSGVVIKK